MQGKLSVRWIWILLLLTVCWVQGPAEVAEGAICTTFDFCWGVQEYLGGLASYCVSIYEYGACEKVDFVAGGLPQCLVWDHCYFVHESSDTCFEP